MWYCLFEGSKAVDRVKWGLSNDFTQYRYLNPYIASSKALPTTNEVEGEDSDGGERDSRGEQQGNSLKDDDQQEATISNVSSTNNNGNVRSVDIRLPRLAIAAYSEQEDTQGFEALRNSLAFMGLSADAVQQLFATIAGTHVNA